MSCVNSRAKSDFKRAGTYGSSKTQSSSGYHSTSRVHAGSASYRSSATASRRLVARSRAPPPSSLNSRMRGRSTLANSRREDELRKRKVVPAKSDFKRGRSGSQSHADDRSTRPSSKDKKDTEDNEKSHDKRQHEEEDVDYATVADGQVVVEEVAGDDDEDVDQEDNGRTGEANSTTDKMDVDHKDDHHKDDQSVKSSVNETKSEDKHKADEGKSIEKVSEDHDKPATTRALLKLHCPYCDVRCISFREFTFHLRSSTHTRTMSGAVSEMKRKLTKVRLEMKEDQRKREKAEKVLLDTSSYCRVCELSFRTDPKEHEANEIHNKIKALIYRRCDVCDIDFRIWKVHIYHMAALEHAKRVAMKELQEGEAKGDNVKGTNLSPEELGLDLVEIRTVFYCNACIRYIPIKGQTDDAKKNHCMTLNHLKNVEEFNEKERRRAQREEARERAKRKKQELSDKHEKRKDTTTDATDETEKVADVKEREEKTDVVDSTKNESGANPVQIKQEPADTYSEDGKTSKTVDGQDSVVGGLTNVLGTSSSENQEIEGQKNMNRNEADEDEDEIELHAGEDDVEEDTGDTGDWSRRTRAGQRGDGSSN
ncbi:hypothetical protein Ocin01_14741 [Orchesella cincta]|uniref:C2H2-type domain-containing protein n=1 Tax=Orchesella cincta TaxID=48709 RepID=A0A1D2MG48_ORCCI|nr:hypothetical protein Ocin01_14741 [Orchesella cincta]